MYYKSQKIVDSHIFFFFAYTSFIFLNKKLVAYYCIDVYFQVKLSKRKKMKINELNQIILLAYDLGQKIGSLECFSVVHDKIAGFYYGNIVIEFLLCSSHKSSLLL